MTKPSRFFICRLTSCSSHVQHRNSGDSYKSLGPAISCVRDDKHDETDSGISMKIEAFEADGFGQSVKMRM